MSTDGAARLQTVEWMDAAGHLLCFVTRAMNNVAGYDLPKLWAGSWGFVRDHHGWVIAGVLTLF